MNDKPKKITNQDIDITNKDTTTQQENLSTGVESQGDENSSGVDNRKSDQSTKTRLDEKADSGPKSTDAD